MSTFRPITTAVAVMTLAGGLALAPLPSSAASMKTGQTTAPQTTQASVDTLASRIETRIKTLHAKLNITPDQEDAWSKVASAMRENETSFKAKLDERESNAATMTAVDDLKSYQEVIQAHADNAQKVVDAFEPLYDSMSDDQKKVADNVFGSYEGRGAQKMVHKAKHMKMAPAAPTDTQTQGQ